MLKSPSLREFFSFPKKKLSSIKSPFIPLDFIPSDGVLLCVFWS